MSTVQESPSQILARMYAKANMNLAVSQITNSVASANIGYVVRCPSNRAGARLLMSCMLAKVHRPEIDPREPYTEIGSQTCFSGRTYDEQHITEFINEYNLPCNNTTAFLTPAFRNHSAALVLGTALNGRPAEMYNTLLRVLNDVATGSLAAESTLTETIRLLCLLRDERAQRMDALLNAVREGAGELPLSSEAIVTLVEQHLACRNSSRLPVLVIAAAYESVMHKMGEEIGPLNSHNAADEQTGALGDVEVYLVGQDGVATSYEMKTRRVTNEDIFRAKEKVVASMQTQQRLVDNYVFVTTEPIDASVVDYARQMYDALGGVEVVVLDCIGFLRHFLHLFHRSRMDFLDAYQRLVIGEPESAIGEPLKTAFLSLRLAAESE